MPTSLRKPRQPGSVGLDIDGAFLAAAEVSKDVLSRAASAELPRGLASDGEIADAEALGDEIRKFFRSASFPRSVRLGVANQQIVVRQIELPRIEDEVEREAAVRFQAAEAVPMPLEDAILDYQLIERVSVDGAPRDRVVVVAARESMIQRLLEAVRGAGLRVEGIDLNAFALVRTLAGEAPVVPEPTLAETARVYCHLGGVVNLAIAVSSTCMFTRPLTTGWDSEEVDLGQFVSALADQIRLSIDFHLNLPGGRRVDEVVLSGPGAKREGLRERLDALVSVPVSVADPLGHLAGQSLPPGEDPHRYTVAAGLALGAVA